MVKLFWMAMMQECAPVSPSLCDPAAPVTTSREVSEEGQGFEDARS